MIFYLLKSSAADTLLMYSPIPKEKQCFTIDMAMFENWSKRSWTDLFLQLYKVPGPLMFIAGVLGYFTEIIY